MILFGLLLWVSLALGGLAGALCYLEALRGKWLQVARIRAVKVRTDRHWHWVSPEFVVPVHRVFPLRREPRAGPPGDCLMS